MDEEKKEKTLLKGKSFYLEVFGEQPTIQ